MKHLKWATLALVMSFMAIACEDQIRIAEPTPVVAVVPFQAELVISAMSPLGASNPVFIATGGDGTTYTWGIEQGFGKIAPDGKGNCRVTFHQFNLGKFTLTVTTPSGKHTSITSAVGK